MQINGSVAFVTGANRGLGRALVDALLARGARHVYAAGRDLGTLDVVVAHDPARITAIRFDLTDPQTIAAAAQRANDVTLLINNASTAMFAPPLDADRNAVEAEMETNYLGSYDTALAFVPALERNGGGAIVNVLSLLALASTPPMAGYSASKAALHSMTQALRPVLRERGIAVHGAYPAGIDTEMLAGIDAPKTPPAEVAAGVLDGLEAGDEDIFPDPNAKQMSALWQSDPKGFERAFAGA